MNNETNPASVDFLVIGAGPAGLGAAIEFASRGGSVLVVDENDRPGGQLAKQIHKFFGSSAHYAGTRGFTIGERLIRDAIDSGVTIKAGTRAVGFLRDGTIPLSDGYTAYGVRAERVLIAAGGKENALPFPGWTLPGVMTAGAAQTFCNVHKILPAEYPVMIGSGNVGLIVTYQLIQAGAEVQGIVEVTDGIGGYEVHAAKIRRAGVPIYLQHTLSRALGEKSVEAIEIYDASNKSIKTIETDGIFLSVGLTPRTELPQLFACRLLYEPALGGFLPYHDKDMRTSNQAVFIAGDAAGIEEANTALDEGRLAGVAAAEDCGYAGGRESERVKEEIRNRLRDLRSGVHSRWRLEAKAKITGEGGGRPMSAAEADTGETVPAPAAADRDSSGAAAGGADTGTAAAAAACGDAGTAGFSAPGYSETRLLKGFVPVIDCPEPIPCNPCVDACPSGAIRMNGVCDTPSLDTETCNGCLKCISICPGLAIRTVKLKNGSGVIALPYEYLPLPGPGEQVDLTDSEKRVIGKGRVGKVMQPASYDKTAVVVLTVPKELLFSVRGFIGGKKRDGAAAGEQSNE